MKSFKIYKGRHEKFSLRKKNVGLVSIAIASLAIYGVALGTPTVQADENNNLSSLVETSSTTDVKSENNSDQSAVVESEKVSSATEVKETEKATSPAPTVEQAEKEVSVSKTAPKVEGADKKSVAPSNSTAVAKEIPAPVESKPAEKSTDGQTAATPRSTAPVRTRRSLQQNPTQISNFSVTVTTKDGTVMRSGDTKPLPAQEVPFDKVQMDFKITQDGTLKKGDVLRIPVKLTNNAYGAYYSNLGSGTSERIEGVGTIKFVHSDPNNLAYEITLDQSFQDMPQNTEKTVSVTQKAATIGKFTAKSSYENIILEINGNKFTFKPTPRTFEKAQAPFAVYNSASSDRANSIKIGTSTGDANYYNNLLSSDGINPGQTGIPNGDIISVHRIKPGNGSKIVSIKPDLKRYTSTLAISEDGKYLVKGDTSTSISINSDPDNKLINLPANSTNDTILKALKQAGKNSSVVIDNGDGTYTVAINLGKMTGNGATTYHDIWPTDDYAQMGDQYQEINRTEEVNKKVSAILKDASVIQGTGHSTRITFADSSIKNTITNESRSYSYNVDDNGNVTKLKEETISATTTPSVARAVGQKKITIHYVDTNGKEIETQDYKYGYPAGGTATPTPDYNANPKTITGYTLVTADTAIASYGTQLKTTKQIPFTSNDQEFYYVYSAKKSSAKVTYIDDDTNGGKVLETKDLNGFYGQTDPYRTAETIKTYTDRNYELVSDNYPATGVTYNETLQTFEVHLKHKKTSVTEEKTVKETIHYTYEGGAPAAPDHTSSLKFTRTATTDLVTNVTTGDWTAENGTSFVAVTSPAIKGYTPDLAEVPAVDNITANSANIEKTVVYKANPASAKVTYIDDTTGETLETKDLNGFYGQTDPYRTAETIKTYTDQNYELVSDNYPTNGVTYNENLQTFEVHLKHKKTSVAEEKTVKETIHYTYEGGAPAAPDHTSSLKFTRTATTDLVTNVTTGDWTAENGTSFAAVTSPTIKGYTPDLAEVPAVDNITANSDNIEKTVVYKANPASAKVTYIDDTTGETLETKDLNGFYGQTDPYRTAETIKTYTDRNYGLVSDGYPATGVTYNENLQTFEVHLRHKGAAVQETKTVTETIKYVYEDNTEAADTKVQTLKFYRINNKDLVTNKIVYKGPWFPSTGTFPEVVSPTVDGYTPDKEKVTAVNVTADQADIKVTVKYKADKQKVTYTIIDDTTNTTLEDKQELTSGNSDTPLPNGTEAKYDSIVNAYLAQGYELVSKDQLPAKFDLDSSHDQNVVVHVKHKVSTSTETKTVTQTINYVYEDDNTPAAPEKKASLTFTREVKTDEVTKDVTPGAWSPSIGTFPEVVSPTVDGYTPDKAKVDAENVTADQADIKVTVKYKADKQKVTYTIIDDTTNTTLEDKQELTSGNSDTPLPNSTEAKYDSIVDAYLAQGYELVSKDHLPAKFDLDSNHDQNVVVHLKHGTSSSQENKAVTMTVRYHGAGSQTPVDKVQTATWTRTVTTDKVTGSVVNTTDWTSDKANYDAVPSPVIPGYTVDVATVPSEVVTQENIVKDVYYTAQNTAQTQKVTYTVVDETTGQTLENQVELTNGESGTSLPAAAQMKYDTVIASYLAQGYEVVSKDELPAQFDTDSSVDQNVVIRLKHKTVSVEETKQVSMTVRYHGAGSQTPADKVQTATWTRTVTTDKVTGSVVSTTDWRSDKANYDAVPSPVIPGYTVDVATVPSEVVTQENIVKDVHYTTVPVAPEVPNTPDTPVKPGAPTTPFTPERPAPTLPRTGESQVGSSLATLTGLGLLLSVLGLAGRQKKEDE